MTTEAPLTIKVTEDKKDEELVHELFKVFPKVFGKKEPRDEYFLKLLAKGDSVQVNDIILAPVVQAVTVNPEIIKRAIHRYRGFTINNETIKQNSYQRSESSNTLIIRELPAGLQAEQVIALFNNEGPKPSSARADQHNNWFVMFASDEDAKQVYASSKNMTYDGKPIRVNMKRDNHVRNNNYDGRPSPMRPEYAEMMPMSPMSPMMSPYPMYYPQMIPPNQYYPYQMPQYSPYPMDMSLAYAYYAQVPQQQPYSYPSPVAQQNFPNRRPGRGNGTPGYNNASSVNGGRVYNGPRKEKSPRSGQQFFPSDAPASSGMEGETSESHAHTASLSAATTTQSESEAAPNSVNSEETTPISAVVESSPEVSAVQAETSKVDTKADTHDNHEKKPRAKSGDNENDGRKEHNNKHNSSSNNNNVQQKRTNSNRGNTSLSLQNNNNAQGNTSNNNNGRNKNSKDRTTGNNKDGNEPKKEKPRAPPVKFTMENDFPILVDQKPVSAPVKSFDYANAVKKVQVPTAATPEPSASSSSTAPVKKEEVAAPPTKQSPPVSVSVSATPVATVSVEVEQPLSFGSFDAASVAVPVAVHESVPAATPAEGGVKKSFADALKQPKK